MPAKTKKPRRKDVITANKDECAYGESFTEVKEPIQQYYHNPHYTTAADRVSGKLENTVENLGDKQSEILLISQELVETEKESSRMKSRLLNKSATPNDY